MTNIMREINKELKAFHPVFDALLNNSEGYDIYLGGGALRELYYMNKDGGNINGIKDLDFFLIPKEGNKGGTTLPIIPKSYVKFNKDTCDVPDIRKRGVERIIGFYTNLTRYEVQFIVYDRHLSQKELAEDMDCNVNQIMFNIETKLLHLTNDFTEAFENKTIKMMHEFSEERMVERLLRMKKRLPSFTLDTSLDLDWYEKMGKKTKRKSGTSSISMVE